VAGLEFGDARRVDIETDDRNAGLGERDRNRQADIAEPDDRDFTSVRHVDPCPDYKPVS
jgi:hypothetical protein